MYYKIQISKKRLRYKDKEGLRGQRIGQMAGLENSGSLASELDEQSDFENENEKKERIEREEGRSFARTSSRGVIVRPDLNNTINPFTSSESGSGRKAKAKRIENNFDNRNHHRHQLHHLHNRTSNSYDRKSTTRSSPSITIVPSSGGDQVRHPLPLPNHPHPDGRRRVTYRTHQKGVGTASHIVFRVRGPAAAKGRRHRRRRRRHGLRHKQNRKLEKRASIHAYQHHRKW